MKVLHFFHRSKFVPFLLIAAQTTGESPLSRSLIKAIDVLADLKERYA